jgi:mannose/fructose/N-acetylgalactosamine-specific phosphotransferase system component IID
MMIVGKWPLWIVIGLLTFTIAAAIAAAGNIVLAAVLVIVVVVETGRIPLVVQSGYSDSPAASRASAFVL